MEISERFANESHEVHIAKDVGVSLVAIDRPMGACIELRLIEREPDWMQIDLGRFFTFLSQLVSTWMVHCLAEISTACEKVDSRRS